MTTTIVPSYNFVDGQHARRWSKSGTRSHDTKEADIQHVSARLQVSSLLVFPWSGGSALVTKLTYVGPG